MLTDGGYQLSGGQRQRVGLARALFGLPQLIVLDEPNSSLDSRGDAALAATIRKLKGLSMTSIIVSHRANLLRLADKILVMSDGRAVNFGDAQAVIEAMSGKKPASQPNGAGPKPDPIVPKPALFNQGGVGA
jgi:ATP-binding cassette subfamily C protein/ATP-binding cassette subfamily C exporter for protease/lipase